ncbi:CBF/Mak21 family-domain-containing protein [Fimicolochytrium jonesii]|uniref:CBF/Mak21 family-domain-containing protein n=1 Tax=Fimicolochytrium jonesii TaxID=1396493 RepID=UPI0022FE4C0B|nr:CBF/Mak21 family-domain-containing protein [Fimicolochytrium jonesii]KAI8820210.1 CBF/Mak21 family-domain-containing protein [Fimicolochytrium jonesii]
MAPSTQGKSRETGISKPSAAATKKFGANESFKRRPDEKGHGKSQQKGRQVNNGHKGRPPTAPVGKAGSRSAARSRNVLLREILSMGGNEGDLDLIHDALSGSEAEDEGAPSSSKANPAALEKEKLDVDEIALLADLQAFMKVDLKLDPKRSKIIEVEDDEEADEEGKEDVKDSDRDEGEDEEEAEDEDDDDTLDKSSTAANGAAFGVQESDSLEEEDTIAATKYGKEDASQVRDMVSQLLKGQTIDDKLSRKLAFDPVSKWFTVALPPIEATSPAKAATVDETFILAQYHRAEVLYQQEVEKFEKSKSMSSADKEFIGTVLKSGTVTDKVSALTLLVQESPLHTLGHLRDQLVNGMARKKARREAVMAIDSVKDLLLGSVLPDRKLKYFRDQPLDSKSVKPVHLIAWYFEDGLKKIYFDFIKLLEELGRDPLLHVKNKMIQYIFDLLAAKPEQEQNLLSLLVNKLGDQERKLASKSGHLLSKLLLQHPVMKLVVIKEVERLLFRSNISDRARYYAITFLNQIVFSHKEQDVAAANRLIDVYFAVFDSLGKRKAESDAEKEAKTKKKDRWRDGKKGKGNAGKGQKGQARKTGKDQPQEAVESTAPVGEVDGIDAKMMAALLTGINRAFPFAEIQDDVFDSHMATLFRITHIGTFNTSIQSLSLIFQVQSGRQSLSDRFYRTLYGTLLDPRLYIASKQAMYLNLVFKALKADTSEHRVKAFVKRMIQICAIANVPFVCATLFLIGEVGKARPGLWTMINMPEEDAEGDVEKFVDADEPEFTTLSEKEAEVPSAQERTAMDSRKQVTPYDGRKRDPLFAGAESSCLWELCQFATHFHPTVALYASTLLSGQPIVPPANTKNYDPLQNHTLQRFLDRFVFKNPKKVESAYKGSSLMQPRVAGLNDGPKDEDRIISAARKRGVLVQNDDVGTVALDDGPVHLRAKAWVQSNGEGVPVDEAFFYEFFKQKQVVTGSNKDKKSKKIPDELLDASDAFGDREVDDEEDDEGEDGEELDEDEVWKAMQKSVGFSEEMEGSELDDDEDSGDEDDFEMFDDATGDASTDDDDENEDVNIEDVFRKMDGLGAGDEDDGGDMADWAAASNDEASGDDWQTETDQNSEDDGADVATPADVTDDEAENSDVEMEVDGPMFENFSEWVTGDEDQDISASEDEGQSAKSKDKAKKKKPSKLAVKAEALGYKGDFFGSKGKSGLGSGLGAFASAEEFEKLLEANDGLDEDDVGGEDDAGSRPRRGKMGGGNKRKRSQSQGPKASHAPGKKSRKR